MAGVLKYKDMKFEISNNSLENISCEAVLVFAYQNEDNAKQNYIPLKSFEEMDQLLDGQIKRACDLSLFKGKRGETVNVVPWKKVLASQVIVVGLGKEKEFILNDLRRAIGAFAGRFKQKVDSVSLTIPELENNTSTVTQIIVEGFLLGSYEFNKYKNKKEEVKKLATVILQTNDKIHKAIAKAIESAELYSSATILARDLINEPGSVATPSALADIAKDIAKKDPNIKCRILEKSQVQSLGMGAFLAVAKGSDTPPKFIHLEYNPNKTIKKKLAIIGKGITFDSGGYDIKPGESMVTMKGDMAGAAAVLGVFSVISKIKPDYSVMGVIAATPNLINGSAFLPDDIVKSYNGKTVEIITTDAEGRLALADQVTYAIKHGATEIIDLATLTGAAMIALGTDITALFSNNRDLVKRIKNAAFESGEKVWEMPLEKDYIKLSESSVADMTNVASTRYGGTITSALFLEEFVEDKPWVHLDIAGPAFLEKPNDLGPKGATGFGVRTLLNFLKL